MHADLKQRLSSDLTFGFVNAATPADQLFHPLLIANEHENTMLRAIKHELTRAQSFVFSVAFITTGALALLKQALIDFEGCGTIITSTYLDFNSPDVFRALLKLDHVDVFVHPGGGAGFHSKGYVFEHAGSTTAIVGSSNLTATALLKNKEWNLRFSALPEGDISEQLRVAVHDQIQASSPLSPDWINEYAASYQPPPKRTATPKLRPHDAVYPNRMQVEALEQIAAVRDTGERRAVVISATGTGKTILAALDVRAAAPKRMLFVVHREQILDKAIESFARVLGAPLSEFGKLAGGTRQLDRKYVFATVQSLSRDDTLHAIDPQLFDYVLIDEVHRAGAGSYKRIIGHLKPKFLLGLTATPERTDGFNIYELFDYNVPYEIRLQAALESDMLAPFNYFGVSEYTDENKNVIDASENLSALVRTARVKHITKILEKYGHESNVQGLIFCSRREEAIQLSEKLNRAKVNGSRLRTVALSGDDSIEYRDHTIERLERGELDYILTVDIFNEGIDVPSINQVVMLRQTQSSIVFTQQLGRGLRKALGKEHLIVIDFIGNYANNYLIPIALLGDNSLNKDSLRQKLREGEEAGAIAGLSSISFDKVSRERVLDSIKHTKLDSMKNLKRSYLEMKQRLGATPLLYDFARFDAIDPVVLATSKRNYWAFLAAIKEVDLQPTPAEEGVLNFLSEELLNGKRPQELLILKALVAGSSLSKSEIRALLDREDCASDEATIKSCIRILTLEFHTKVERKTYGDLPLIVKGKDGRFSLDSKVRTLFDRSSTFSTHAHDCIQTGLFRARHLGNWNGAMQAGRLYSRKDVCRLLNWTSNQAGVINGYKVDTVTSSCPIFVNYKKDPEVSASVQYEDELLDHSTMRWFTKNKRKLTSAQEARIIANEVSLHLFTRKDDREGIGFHYLGPVVANGAEQTTMPDKAGTLLPVVTMNLRLETPLEEGLYSYLTGK